MAGLYSKFITDHFLNKMEQPKTEVFDDSNIPYQERPDYISEQTQQEIVPEPVIEEPSNPAPNPYNLQSLKSKETNTISGVLNRLNQMPKESKQIEISEPDPFVKPSPKEDIMGDYQKQLEAAQQDRAQKINSSALRSAASGMFNAGLIYSGNQHRVPIGGSAHEDLKRQEGLKIEELNEKLKLPTNVSAAEKAKMEMNQMQELQDPNSLTSQSLRSAIKQFLGEHISEDVLNRMTGPQLKQVAEEIGALKKDKFAMDDKDRSFDLQERMFQDQSARGWAQINKEKAADSKEEIAIRKENRKEAKKIEDDIKSTEGLLKDLNKAVELFNRYSKKGVSSVLGGTGPLVTLGGQTKYFSQQAQDFDAQVKKINLDTMVKMFAGMSKAVDSNAERRAFEAAQPNLILDDKINERLLTERIQAAKSLLDKQRRALTNYDRYGNFVEPSEEPRSPAESSEVRRKTSDGRVGIFDANSKQFLRWE